METNVAKKASTTRVFQLAKELGVTSKDIVAKCQAEEIPGITNHMSAVSLGLAATVREWFGNSESSVATAVESAAVVDVDEARKKAAKRATKKKATAKKKPAKKIVVEEPVAEKPVIVEAAPPVVTTEPVPVAAEVEEPAAPESVEAPPAPVAEAPPVVEEPKAADEPVAEAPAADVPADENLDPNDPKSAIPNVPNRPNVIKPAGPMLNKPKKTALAGPKIIRVEKPDNVPVPSRRGPGGGGGGRGPGGGPGGPGGGPSGPMDAPGDASRGGRGTSSRRNRRRTTTSRDDGQRAAANRTGGDRGSQQNWRQQDLLEREQRLNRSSGFFKVHRRDKKKRTGAGTRATTAAKAGGSVKIEEPISIKALSQATGLRVNDIIRTLVKAGTMVTNADAVMETEMAREFAMEHNIELEVVEHVTAEDKIVKEFETREMVDEQSRSPVVTILGHVDHGKTTLLDSIRKANVAAGEAGGITQATSAFQVPVTVNEEDHLITFIDTPGHEAFTEMRARGAKVTDIAVLVVAADDGVMPQTIESINHAREAGVPIIVALNKVDKAEATEANIQRIFGELAEHDLQPVEWGGTTEVVKLAALKGEGVTELLEIIDYQAQLLELKADFGGASEGTVIEASMKEGRGAVATMLVQQGKLKKGDVIVVGRAYGRVRDIVNDHGKRIDEAGPGVPIAVSGLNEVPDAGDKFYIVKNIRAAEASANERIQQERESGLATEKVTLDNIFDKLAESGRKELPLIVKADTHGSVETLRATLAKIANDEVRVVLKHAAVGAINQSDVSLAEASGAIVVAFNVTSTPQARRLAEQKKIDLRYYDVIYDITDDVTKAAEGLLAPELKLEILGHAEVRDVFRISKVGMVAGCYVTDGNIQRDALIRVTRDGAVIESDRKLDQLKRFKNDAKEVNAGQECGMRIIGYDDVKVGDVLECYLTKEIRRSLNND